MHFSLLNYSIKKKDLSKLFERLKKEYEIIAPVKNGSDYNFQNIDSTVLDLDDYINTRYPAKEFFLPSPEKIFTFTKNKRLKISSNFETKKRLIFGMRPCDVNGLLVLDKIFIDDYPDPFYKNRRENTVIISLNCNKAGPYCFCQSLGTDTVKDGADLIFTDSKSEYSVEIGSVVGEKIVNKNKDLFKFNSKKIKKPKLKFKKKVDTETVVEDLKNGIDHKIWKKEADRCISCAACTIVCPTCYCYDVQDVNSTDGKEGNRVREWNFCMLYNFTRVAGNMVFRPDRVERLKQFVYHKLSYLKETDNIFLCVGCGRCIQSCIVDIDLTKIVKKLRKK